MDRRETIKTLLLASLASGAVWSACKTKTEIETTESKEYGRTPEESERDEELYSEEYLITEEITSIAILCDIILPASNQSGSATDAGVTEFIEFIVKDIPKHQLKIRGGLMWLDNECTYRFNKTFSECQETERIEIIDEIAYPKRAKPEMDYGANFFSLIRSLVLSGYFTTKMGIEDLGYVGNRPNAWDGVPEDVLKKHNLAYEPEWLSKCIDQEKRNEIARWDNDANLIY